MSIHVEGVMTVVEHSWSETWLYIGDRRIAMLETDEDEVTEDTADAAEQERVATAHRLAACWNACAQMGLGTSDLEDVAEIESPPFLSVHVWAAVQHTIDEWEERKKEESDGNKVIG